MANELRRRRASCVEMLKSFTHGGKMADLVIDDRRDRGDISNGGAQQGGTAVSSTWAPGIADRMGLVVAGLVQITSDFSWFKCRPNSDPTHCTISRSWLISSRVPPTEPSSRYHTLNSDFNWEQRSCMDRQKRSQQTSSPRTPLRP